jgi:hypothetical protein
MADPVMSHPEPQPGPRGVDVAIGHEERDVAARPIALSVVGLAILAGAAFVAMLLLFNVFAKLQARWTDKPSPLAATYGPKEPPEPRLQTDPLKDLLDLRARDAAALQGYGWVDRGAGTVRIPIARAIDVLAERGLPARSPAPQGGRQ